MGILFLLLQVTFQEGDIHMQGVIMKFVKRLYSVFSIQEPLVFLAVSLIIIVLFKNIVGLAHQFYSTCLGHKMRIDTQERLFRKFIKADYLQFVDYKQGEILHRIYGIPTGFSLIAIGVPQILIETVKVIFVGGVLLTLQLKLMLIIGVFCGAYYFFIRYVVQNVSYKLGAMLNESNERQNVLINEMGSGIRQIKLYDAESRWENEFKAALSDFFLFARQDGFWVAIPKHLLDFSFMTIVALLLIILHFQNPNGFISALPSMGVFAYGFLRLMPSMNGISTNWMHVIRLLPSLEQLHESLERKLCTLSDGGKKSAEFKHSIEFKEVSFHYHDREQVLKDFSLTIKKGEMLALVGPSGSGKTTVLDLIIRFFDPTEGSVFVDGSDLRQIYLPSWRRLVGYVSQDAFIFNASIADNIAFGHEKISQEQIIKAAKKAYAHEFIMQLPEKYNTVVGDRGLKISGGQRQRIAIARALLKQPEILILDEATSALDNISERFIQEAIASYAKNHTVIIIAHRLSTIRNADRIVLLDRGHIVEEGTHAELVKKGGMYQHLHSLQVTSQEVKVMEEE